MRRDLPTLLIVLAALAGCGGGGGIGESCSGNGDCDSDLQCLAGKCARLCDNAPDCGDGYSCNEDHRCAAAQGRAGDTCHSEVECEAGLSCRINGAEVNSDNRLISSCVAETSAHAAGEPCEVDADCRRGACDLGHCVDLCTNDRDCALGSSCATIPRVAVAGAFYAGCLPSHATLTWTIPVTSPTADVLLPVPFGAESAELVMSVDDPSQLVGAKTVLDPCGCTRYQAPCPLRDPGESQSCSEVTASDQYFALPGDDPDEGNGSGEGSSSGLCGPSNCRKPPSSMLANHIRHLPALGRSVLLLPSSTRGGELKNPGAYQIDVSSFWPTGLPGSAVPRVTAVVHMDFPPSPDAVPMTMTRSEKFDLHFFFVDLADHPCMAGETPLSAATAPSAPYFQGTFLGALKEVFRPVSMAPGSLTYEDITMDFRLDAPDVASIGALLSLGKYATGINVFFVRSLSPIGTQSYSPNPGPAGVAHTPESGIAIALDTLCYRHWDDIARVTAHQIARYMGLYHNVEPRDPRMPADAPPWQDPIGDSDLSPGNLMYFAEHAGTTLSLGQREILSRSAALQ